MKIGKITVSSRVFLAPIAGTTDIPFRILCKEYGAGMVFTEMINCRSLIEKNPKALALAETSKDEGPVGVQLFGSKPDEFRKAAKLVKTKIIDINFGCPMQKVTKNGSGSALLDKPDLMKEIVQAVKKSKKTVMAKIRLGYTKNNVIKNCKILEKAGVDAITIHARNREQYYSGKADWKYIRLAKKTVSIPIIGNGDIDSGKKAESMLEIADFCMIGRAAMGHPRIFKRVNDYLKNNEEEKFDFKKQLQDFDRYYKLTKKYKLDDLSRLKVHAVQFVKGFKGANKVRLNLNQAKTKKELIEMIMNAPAGT
ncbi:MAG: tRNA-dihydrouridine synthase family protein [Nanoarchaeota archaeon]|nr:tRNA-dihydrouridine synthase family protein [Nanoarchaeota archaeon]